MHTQQTRLKLTPGQLSNLAAVPEPTPKVTIISAAFDFTIGCFISSSGALWVVDASANAVHEFTHSQLAAATLTGGTVDLNPAVTITDGVDLASPAFATMDAAGNLWVTSEANNKVVEFAANSLGTTGSPPPKVEVAVVQETATGIARALLALTAAEIKRSRRSLPSRPVFARLRSTNAFVAIVEP
jgi:hypothetical protein